MINLLRILIAPAEVFSSMREHIPILPPFFVLVAAICVCYALQPMFISSEEYVRLNEDSAEMSQEILQVFLRPGQAPEDSVFSDAWEAQQDQLDRHLESMNTPESLRTQKRILMVFNPLTTLFTFGVAILLEATYFLVAGNLMKCSKQWSEWIGFTLWTSIPLVLFLILYTTETVRTGDYYPVGIQAPLSWIPGLESNPFALAVTISVGWTLWVRVIGMHHWVKKPIEVCLIVALIPAVLGVLITAGGLTLVPME